MNQHHEFTAPEGGGRIDLILTAFLPDISRTRIQRLIKRGEARVDGVVVEKPGYLLDGGEQLQITIPEPTPSHLEPEAQPLDIVFESTNLIIVNKPPGLVVHPSPGHKSGTLVQAVMAHAPDIRGVGDTLRPGVVHRLDKDTSGLIIFAKDDSAHRWVQRQFQDRQVEKTYHAIVDGRPPTPKGKVDAAIGRDQRHRQRMGVVPDGEGRSAVTVYHTEENFPDHSLLEVHPRTGRTHQIRVHLSFLGCSVVGDTLYGSRTPSLPVQRQMLHASALSFRLPGEDQPSDFSAELADDFQAILELLRAEDGS